jgi:AraC-like DNA-binding protein
MVEYPDSTDLHTGSASHNYSLDRKAIPMAQVQNLVQVMEEQGFPVSLQLKGTGITAAQLGNSDTRITYRQRIKQLENMLFLRHEPGFWLKSPREVSISEFGLLGYAMMSSATLEQAIHIAVKYHRMAGALFDLTFSVEGEEASLKIEHLMPVGEVAHYVVEDLFIGLGPLVNLLLGREYLPSAVRFNYSIPDASLEERLSTREIRDRYQVAFRSVVEFDSPWCEYRFDAKLLGEPLAAADTNTARICEESCRQLLDQMEIQDDFISKICHLLLASPGDFPKLDDTAHRLSMGARTLRRRLKELGTSYQNVLDDVRKELAVEYLQTTNLSVQEISDLLGYSEVTNFRRAFLKWVGESPYQYRKRLPKY